MDQIAQIERLSKKFKRMLKKQKLLHEKIILEKLKLIREGPPTKKFLQDKLKYRISLILAERNEELVRTTEKGLTHRIEEKYNAMILERKNILSEYRQRCDEYAYAAYGRAETLVRRCERREITPIYEKMERGTDPVDFLCAATQRLTLDKESFSNLPVCMRPDFTSVDISSRPALPLSHETRNPPKRRRKHHLAKGRKYSHYDASFCHSHGRKSVTKDIGVQTGKAEVRPGTKRRLRRPTKTRTQENE